METVTYPFTEKRATITFPNGDTESITYVRKDERPNSITYYGHIDDSFSVHQHGGAPRINFRRLPEESATYSTQNIRKVSVDWTYDLVAVADVEIEEEHDRRLLRQDKVTWSISNEPEIEIWEKHDWDASQN